MSMGKWNEDAQTDEMGLIRSALSEAKRVRAEEIAQTLGITPLAGDVKVSVSKRRGAKVRKVRLVGPKYPYEGIDAEGRHIRYRVLNWTEGSFRLEVRTIRRTPRQHIGVDNRMNLSNDASVESNPEWLFLSVLDKLDGWDDSDVWEVVGEYLTPTETQNPDNLERKVEGEIYRAMSFTSDKPGHSCDDNAIRDDAVKRSLRDEATAILFEGGYGVWGNPLPIDA